MRVAIVGTGVAGLGAARLLRKAGAEVALFEKEADFGGRCRTHEWNGTWIIRGAAAFVGGEEEPVALARELGIYREDNLKDCQEEDSFTVLHKDRGLVDLGSVGRGLVASKVIPLKEKLALLGVLPRVLSQRLRADRTDPTSCLQNDTLNACAYLRRFSPSFVEYVLEPILAQYTGFGEDDYSLGWLIWSVLLKDGSPPWTFRDRGTGLLTATLQQHFEQDPASTIHLNSRVERLEEAEEGALVTYTQAGRQRSERFDGLVCAVPGSLVNDLMPGLPLEHRTFFDQVEYIGHHVFHAIIDRPKEDLPPSILYPTIDGYQVISNSWLLPFREPDKAIFYGEIKGKCIREAGPLGDDEFVERAWAEARRGVPGLRDSQLYDHHLQRNDIAICRHHAGYMQALANFNELPPLPHIAFAGDYLTNSTVGQAYRSGVSAAEQLLSGSGAAQLARAS